MKESEMVGRLVAWLHKTKNRNEGIIPVVELKGSKGYFFASFLGAAFLAAGFAGLALPKLPAKVFPFLVLISPRPIYGSLSVGLKKARHERAPCF